MADQRIKIAVCNRRTDKKYKHTELLWSELAARCKTTIRTTETIEEFLKFKKSMQDDIKDHGGFVGGELAGGLRKMENVISRSIGCLDADNIPENVDFISLVKEQFADIEWFDYTTHKHTVKTPRHRLVFLFSRAVSGDEYQAIMRQVAKRLNMDYFDDTTYQANRMMFFPTTSKNGEFVFAKNHGVPLDVDYYLSLYSDWRDVSLYPTSSRQSEVVARTATTQADPLTKNDIVGCFCRTYSITQAIETFLPDIYEETIGGRYSYLKGESANGGVVYDDKFFYSHHATDPACGKLCNSFDLVAVHKFPNLEDKARYKAMADFASKDEKVGLLILEEKQKQAAEIFDDKDWQRKLRRKERSIELENCTHNLILIMQNDEYLKNIVFNQLADSMEVIGDLPWKKQGKFWRDADDSQLICYIDNTYGVFTGRNYNAAVSKVVDDRSYHPILDYFAKLPPWDGIKRVETLLVKYLGAVDNKYTRSVTRKTLVAAVARVKEPGCKFDSMLVLNGKQGIGKSTLISKLGQKWFSDSLSINDLNHDGKAAAEKLQGFWIIEIGELDGFRKAEIDKIKAFVSRQDDKYRAAFGRRVTSHPRQSIFFGTTNSENGYLRDVTGNRRFWPVKLTGESESSPFELTQDVIDQIWAETLIYYNQGEKLYLPHELEQLAEQQQREAMETDDRMGLVADYLEMLLPENWGEMDENQRSSFLNKHFDSDAIGTVKREFVCNLEIWCECFGKSRADLQRKDSYVLSGIMKRIGGWEFSEKAERHHIYGVQKFWHRRA